MPQQHFPFRLGASFLAGLFALLMVGLGVSPAAAAPVPQIDASTEGTLVIHKLEQPQQMGLPATGERHELTEATPISGVEFQITRIPGVDLTNNDGWDKVEELTPAQADAAIGSKAPDAEGTTDESGELTFDGLDAAALYLVEETSTPEGVIDSAPFLVTMPHPHEGQWLYTVHAYPKNAVVTTGISVRDQDTISAEDTVEWESRSSIPRLASIGEYRVEHTLAPGLQLRGGLADTAVTLDCSSCSGELEDEHYELSADFAADTGTGTDGTLLSLRFNYSGRALLAEARAEDANAQVLVQFQTTIPAEGIAADGEYRTTVELTAQRDTADSASADYNSADMAAQALSAEPAIATAPASSVSDSEQKQLTDSALTKFGPLRVIVHERDNPELRIPGLRFQVHLTPEDALAGEEPLTIDGSDEWTTDAQGLSVIHGLRFSDFVNGLDRDLSDPHYRRFYVAVTHIPEGWEGQFGVYEAAVESATEPVTLNLQLWRQGELEPPAPSETAVPSETPGPSESPAPSETSGPTDTSHPSETSAPFETPGADEDLISEQPSAGGADTPVAGGDNIGTGHRDSGLAVTGTQITGLILLSLLLVGVGWVLVMRRRTQNPRSVVS